MKDRANIMRISKPPARRRSAMAVLFVLFATDHVRADQSLPSPVEPASASSTIVVPAGFRVELVAAEPLVRDPVAMEFDENGSAYVIELPPYNEHAKPGQKTHSSICRLDDTDHDGRFDKRTTFVDDLNYATGLFCYDGGLFVGDPPDLLYLRDTDGDGRADTRETVLTGFGAAPAGESQLNSFRWGLDNRIHICTGLDGGDVRVVRGSPDPAPMETSSRTIGEVGRPAPNSDAQTRNVRNRRLLLEPHTRTFELTSDGGQNGMSFDDWGRTYVCDNSLPIEEILYDDRYVERNPHMSAPGAKGNIGPGANFTKLARISPPEAWRRIRTRLREKGAEVDDSFEPGRDSGQFTSATGITIYRGDAWPREFRGHALVGEVAHNLVYIARLKPDGLTTASERVSADAEFMASTDTWFRPVQFAHGPDGSLYVLDMYRQLIEGVQWVPPQVLAKMDPTAGNDRGRIYRIVPNDFKPRPFLPLRELSTEALVGLLAHENGWHRETAARLLYERQDQNAAKPLRRMLAESESALGRLHALYALAGLNALEPGDVLCALGDVQPRIREHAVRLAERFAATSSQVQAKLAELTSDPDVRVRFQLAFSAGMLPTAQRDAVLMELLRRDGHDAWFRMAIQSSLGTGAATFFRLVVADLELRRLPHCREFLAALAAQTARANDGDAIRGVVAAVDALDEDGGSADSLAESLVRAMLADGTGLAADELMARSQGRSKLAVVRLITAARTAALNQETPPDSRVEAISILGCGSFSSQRTAFDELLAPQQPQPVQQAVLKTLGRFTDSGVVELLLARWPGFTPGLRASAAEVLLSRPAWAETLLAAVEKNEIARGDFDSARVALLKAHPSPKVRERAAAVFSDTVVARRADVLAQYQASLKLGGDTQRGRAVFQKSCAACHQLEGIGTAIGADLRAIRDRGPDAVLLNILDPNREIQPNFLTYVVITTDGRAVTGIITEETPNNLTIRQADGSAVAVPRTDIDEMTSTGVSYMPEGLEKEIDPHAMADLLAFLMTAGSHPEGTRQAAGSGK